jgi:uncharacterized membrane protein YqiK
MFEWFTKSKKMSYLEEEIARLQEAERQREEENKRQQQEAEEQAKAEAEKAKLQAEEEPWVKVVNLELDPQNQSNGIFELDWNKKFVEMLGENGYSGKNDEEIVNLWFNDVCRSIAAQTEQDFDPNMTMIPVGNVKY